MDSEMDNCEMATGHLDGYRERPASPQSCPSHDGLISPRKLRNPCIESKERQNLHRELLMNQKMGTDVLKKSELQKKLEDRENARKKREAEDFKKARRTSLEMIMEKRANKYKEEEAAALAAIKEDADKPEYLKIHAKLRATRPSEDSS